MRLLVFKHVECEHPGSLRRFLARDRINWDAVELYAGQSIPDLSEYDALWVMGGPMDVWDVEEYPWLVAEKTAIKRWVRDLCKPFLGLCLGHQLLADALGGTCGPQVPAEIGVMAVDLTEEGRADPLFSGMAGRQKCLQWHSVRVTEPPDGAVVLARSPACLIQAMRVGSNAWSMQYHVEIEPDTVSNWAAIPAYRKALVDSMGGSGVEAMSQCADDHMEDFLASAETLYHNFMRVARAWAPSARRNS